MDFFSPSIDVLSKVIMLIGSGLGVWGPAGLITNIIANIGKGQYVSLGTIVRICEALD